MALSLWHSGAMMIDVGGYSVTAYLTPGNEPAVVFVSQIGTDGASWRPVIERLTCRSAVVTYDRPAIGDSPPRPNPKAPVPYSLLAAELATMLDGLGVTEPVVLAGHSVGSLFIRMFAAQNPSRVAGMVHVDGSIPALLLWPRDSVPADGDGSDASPLDPVIGEREMAAIVLPAVPGAVLVRTPGRWAVKLPDPALDAVWQEAQAALTRQCGATLIGAVDAGHQIPREAPSLVAFAVDAVVDAARGGHVAVEIDPAQLAICGGRLLDQ
jgi:pimeloyl-ACP methyl ester carboxylesterase